MTRTRDIYYFTGTRNKMKMLALLSIFFTVALGMPKPPGADQSPLMGDLLPVQGHVVIENPAPQLRLYSKKEPVPPQGGDKQEKNQKDQKNSEVKLNEVHVFADKPQLKDNQDLLEQEAAPMAPSDLGQELLGQGMELAEAYLEPDIENTKTEDTDTERTYEWMEQPIMKLEPVADEEMPREEQLNQQFLSKMAAMEDEGPMLDALGKPMQPLEEYSPISKDFIGLEPETDQHVEKMGIQATFEEKDSNMPIFGEPRLYEWRSCVGVVLEGKCYQFFESPKKAADAEFFCQERFPGGHLASIRSPVIHNEIMNLMQQNGGHRRTWVGGLRFLDTGRFIWLDGSHWGYDDWLKGEPNNTSNLENCLEVLASGKFNDFTCWEPQAFICSYPYQ